MNKIKYKILTQSEGIKKGIYIGTINEARDAVRRDGNYIIYLKEIKKNNRIDVHRNKKISIANMKNICNIMSLYVKSGMPLNDGVKAVASTIKEKEIKRIFENIYEKIIRGQGFYGSFKEEKAFPTLFLIMIKSGEKSGFLEETFEALEKYYESQFQFLKRMKEALIYPVTLAIFMNIVFLFILGRVIPKFKELIEYNSSNISNTMSAILTISKFVEKNLFQVFLLELVILIIVVYYCKVSRVYSKIPVIKGIYKDIEIIYFFKVFNMLYKSGISIQETLDLICKSLENKELIFSIKDIRTSISNGYGVFESFKATTLLDEFSKDMIYFGEKTGYLEKTIDIIEKHLNEILDKKLRAVLKFIEPIMIIFMGTMIVVFILIFVMPTMNTMYYIE